MIAEPIPDTEYTLVRTVDAQLHVATFIRYPDNSGSIRHGGYGESWEFNWAGLLDSWRALRGAGWITLEEGIVTLRQTLPRLVTARTSTPISSLSSWMPGCQSMMSIDSGKSTVDRSSNFTIISCGAASRAPRGKRNGTGPAITFCGFAGWPRQYG